jgi:hypothetical protein
MTVDASSDWRRLMRRDVFWALVVKLGLLVLLWGLFFSPAHRAHVDGEATSQKFAVSGAQS